jgi:cobalt-zinc-cadmium efflux system protein
VAHDHSHGVSWEADSRRLFLALALIVAFMAAEIVAGIVASSLALLSDAAHMLTDAAAIAMALVALRLARRPPGGSYTYGLKRAEILSAQANGITLGLLALLILYEAVRRLGDPPDVEGALVLAVALVGIPVSVAATWLLAGAERRSLNVEGAFQHVLTDLFAFVATAAAGALILATGYERADTIASLLVAALMLRAAYRLLRDSGRVFMEASPRGLDPQTVGRALASQPGVTEVHDLHVWEVTSGMPALSAHVVVGRDNDCHRTRWQLARLLAERFGVEHSTLQVEHERGDDLLEVRPLEERSQGDG